MANVSEKRFPRLLIISHNLYDTNNNIGKTLVSLLEGWPKELISEAYFSNDYPTFKYSNSYYQILDKDVVKSCFSKKTIVGKALEDNNSEQTEGKALSKLHAVGNRRIPTVSAIRDLFWKNGKWKTKDFSSWLKNVSKPDLILFVPNDYCLAYDVASFVLLNTNATIVPFYMDDAFYYGCRTSFVDWLRRKALRKKAKLINDKSKFIFTICKAMSLEYEKLFNIKCYDFINSIELVPSIYKDKKDNNCSFRFVYSGNLHSNRWRSLVKIAKALTDINKEKGYSSELIIVTASNIEPKVLKKINSIPLIKLKNKVSNEELKELQFSADILVYAESFKNKDINNLRLSMSTKIPEYFRCNAPIFAYGPINLASIQYFKNEDLAFVCDSKKKNKLKQVLLKSITDTASRVRYAEKGLKESIKYNIKERSADFKDMLLSSVGEK